MTSGRAPHREFNPIGWLELLGAVLLVALVTVVAGPVLRHTEQSVIPWPIPGIVLALLFSVRPQHRTHAALALFAAVFLGAGAHSGVWDRAAFAAMILTAQSIIIVLLHQRFTDGRHPLRGTTSYAWLGLAILIGLLPIIQLATPFARSVGGIIAPDYTLSRWWISSVTSMCAITPVLLAPTAPLRGDLGRGVRARLELPLLASAYALALFSAFFSGDASPFALPPIVATVPFLVWAGLRLGVRGYAVFSAMFVLVVVTATFFDVGPFVNDPGAATTQGRIAWIYLASLAGPTMMVPLALAERSAAVSRARAVSAQLGAIIESSADPIAAVDRDLTLVAANPTWAREMQRLYGEVVRVGTPVEALTHRVPLDAAELMEHWRRALGGEQVVVTLEIGDPANAREGFDVTFSPVRDARGDIVGASQIMRNVTERRRRELAAAEAHRLESLGRLAGGVAHDFNNLMTAVIGYSSIISHSLSHDDPRQADLAEIEKAATRAGGLTQQLLSFARRRVVAPRDLDVGELVTDCLRSVDQLLGSAVRMQVRLDDDLPRVRIDPAQFEQVIMNLAVNALEAMPSGGEIAVTVERIAFGGGEGVRISLRDTGIGMSPEVVARIWEPFYTTKPMGKGTGLGLATVHGTVHQAGGDVEVESTPGVGSTFHIRLPAAGPATLSLAAALAS